MMRCEVIWIKENKMKRKIFIDIFFKLIKL